MSVVLRDYARECGRLLWAVDELLLILDRPGVDAVAKLSASDRAAIARAREIADSVRPGGTR